VTVPHPTPCCGFCSTSAPSSCCWLSQHQCWKS